MPGTPVYKETATHPMGWPLVRHSFDLIIEDSPEEAVGYSATYIDYPEFIIHAVKPRQLLELARRGAGKGPGEQLLRERNISLDSYPGKEFTVVRARRLVGTTRCYLVRQRLYMLMAVVPKTRAASPDALRFLDSFRLLKP